MPPPADMTGAPQVQTATYTCAVCHAEVERDLLVFLRHTDQHILEALRELHPEWADGDGQGSQVRTYYRAQLGHDPW